MGIAAERENRRSRGARSALRRGRCALRIGGSAASELGRRTDRRRARRVLAGARVAAARPARMDARERRLVDRAACAMKVRMTRLRLSPFTVLIALGIANHLVLTG